MTLPITMLYAGLLGALMAVLFLRERMHHGRWIALGLGFLGILVILRPGLEVVSLGALVMLGCTFCFGATSMSPSG